jgi:hypothetical protein
MRQEYPPRANPAIVAQNHQRAALAGRLSGFTVRIAERFADEANRLVSPPRRQGYELPTA